LFCLEIELELSLTHSRRYGGFNGGYSSATMNDWRMAGQTICIKTLKGIDPNFMVACLVFFFLVVILILEQLRFANEFTHFNTSSHIQQSK
jgi:hypothetical protein